MTPLREVSASTRLRVVEVYSRNLLQAVRLTWAGAARLGVCRVAGRGI